MGLVHTIPRLPEGELIMPSRLRGHELKPMSPPPERERGEACAPLLAEALKRE
jgi:hypothetical protein